jgi:N-acetylneuraminate synthase
MGVGAAVAAVALGATIIEKHFCLSRAEGGVDSAFSLEPQEMKDLVEETRRAHQALGFVQYGVQVAEQKSLLHKRSIYVVQDIEPGEVFSTKNIRVIRPGDGLPPKYFEAIIGTVANRQYKRGMPLTEVISLH